MFTLCFVRHGKTEWTKEKRFSGWGNAPLSEIGRSEAISAGKTFKQSGHMFDLCFTSRLMRAHDTAEIIWNELNLLQDKVLRKWRLNERHYGALQCELRRDMRQKFGNADVKKWRNDYHAQPPRLTDNDPRWLEQLERLPEVPLSQQPRGESMMQAAQRTRPLWEDEIAPALRAGKRVLIVAHTNSIRSLTQCVEHLNDAQLAAFRISTGVARHYELNGNLEPLKIRDLTRSTKAKLHHWVIRKKLERLG